MNKKEEALVKFIEIVKSTNEDEFDKKYIKEAEQGNEEQGDGEEKD